MQEKRLKAFTKINRGIKTIAVDNGLSRLLISEKKVLGLHLALLMKEERQVVHAVLSASLYFITESEKAIACAAMEDFL